MRAISEQSEAACITGACVVAAVIISIFPVHGDRGSGRGKSLSRAVSSPTGLPMVPAQTPPSELEERATPLIQRAAFAPAQQASASPIRHGGQEISVRTTLKNIVEKAQRDNVRLSWGPYQGQCYTDQNLQEDLASNKPVRIAERLAHDRQFIGLANALKSLPAEERTVITNSARVALHQTWTERGGVVDANGQTDAGKQMELMIANSVVDQLLRIVDKPILELEGASSAK